jgi:hypothetical protein
MKSVVLSFSRYLILIGFGLSNVLLFQNCSNWKGNLVVKDGVDAMGSDEEIIPIDNPKQNNSEQNQNGITDTQTGDDGALVGVILIADCLPSETSSLSCPNNPGLSNGLVCKLGKFVDDNGKDDCTVPDLNPAINGITLTSPGPGQVKIEIDVTDDQTAKTDLTIYYLDTKVENGVVLTVPAGQFTISPGDIKVVDDKQNSTTNSQTVSITVAGSGTGSDGTGGSNHPAQITSVNMTTANCGFTLSVRATDADGDTLKYFLDGKEFINGTELQTSKSDDITISSNLSVVDFDAGGNVKSTTNYSGTISAPVTCDNKAPVASANLVVGDAYETVVVTIEAIDQSALTYSLNNGPFQTSNIFTINTPPGESSFSLSSSNFIVVKDAYGNQTIVANSEVVQVKLRPTPPPADPCEGFISEKNSESLCPTNYMIPAGYVVKTSSCLNDGGSKKIEWTSDYSACGAVNQCSGLDAKTEKCGSNFLNSEQSIAVNCVPSSIGVATWVRDESSCVAPSCSGSANDPNRPASKTCGSGYENADTVIATYTCVSQNTDGTYIYSQPQSTGETCTPLFCSTQSFDANVFAKTCADMGSNYTVTGTYSCDEANNSITLPICEKKCSDDKIYVGGTCTCATGQKLSSQGVCYTPAANLCADTSAIKVYTTTVSFAEPSQSCKWGIEGNLSIKDTKVRARNEQYQQLSLPVGATVCSMNFTFGENQSMLYDDHILMTYNDIVFATTQSYLLSYLENKGTATGPLYQYNWAKLLGGGLNSAYAGSTSLMCLDTRSTRQCSWPATQQTGTIKMTIDPMEIQRISDLSVDKTNKSFGMITTGDNDSTDCKHKPISFNVQINYATEP